MAVGKDRLEARRNRRRAARRAAGIATRGDYLDRLEREAEARHRGILELRNQLGGAGQLAKHLDISLNAAKKRLTRAREFYRKRVPTLAEAAD